MLPIHIILQITDIFSKTLSKSCRKTVGMMDRFLFENRTYLRVFEKAELQTTTNFSSKYQEKSSCLMFLYEHYRVESDIPRHKLFSN